MNEDLIDQNKAETVGLTRNAYLETLRKRPEIPRVKIGRRIITKRADWLALLAPAKPADVVSR